jgi:hypothetical protein
MSISCEMLEDVNYLLGLLKNDIIESKNELINSKPFVCDVLDAIERLNVENMNKAGIMTNFPYNVCENIIVYVGECLYCDYNDEYVFFTEQYNKLEAIRIKAIENIRYENYGPSLTDCKEQESPMAEIIQSEQYALWAGQVLFEDVNDESVIRINCTRVKLYKNATNAINKVEIEAMEYISNLTNIPIVLLNIMVEFTGSVLCDYRSHHNYLSNLVIKNIRTLHIFEQPLVIQTRMYIRHLGLKDYNHTVQTVKLFKRKLAEFIPRLNSTNQLLHIRIDIYGTKKLSPILL